MTKTVKVLIEGRVQGVWYRGWTQEMARNLGIDGWVQNRRDGSVQAVFSGPDLKVDEMIKCCWDGPISARVTNVSTIPHDGTVPAGFRVKRTI